MLFFSLICPWLDPSFSQKMDDYLDTVLMLPIIDFVSYYAHSGPVIDARCCYRLKICIIGSKVYNGQQKYVTGHLQTNVGPENGQAWKKSTACNKDPLLFLAS
jgi:hypothetical protein